MIRNIGALLVRGFKPRDVLTQLHGARDVRRRRARTAPAISAISPCATWSRRSPCSGDLIPVMTGVAMAGRYLGQKIVAMTWIGDGGTSTGAFHEGLNLAAVQKAPLVLIIENNQWAYSTPVSAASCHCAIWRIGRAPTASPATSSTATMSWRCCSTARAGGGASARRRRARS